MDKCNIFHGPYPKIKENFIHTSWRSKGVLNIEVSAIIYASCQNFTLHSRICG